MSNKFCGVLWLTTRAIPQQVVIGPGSVSGHHAARG